MLDRIKSLWKPPQGVMGIDGNRGNLEKLIADKPRFHLSQGELTSSWSIQADTLQYIHSLLQPGMKTLETGCGQTTVVFALAGARHICIMPNSEEAERVKRYCIELGLKPDITFIIESSDAALSRGDLIPHDLDFVLIDGAHAFPAPIIDWHYTAGKLRIGGIMCVDDYKMPSVKILSDYLRVEDEEWAFINAVQNTAFFRKLREPRDPVHWNGQKINASYPGY